MIEEKVCLEDLVWPELRQDTTEELDDVVKVKLLMTVLEGSYVSLCKI